MRPLLLLAAALFLAIPAMAQDENNRPLITVSGQAEVLVVPDEAVFTMSAVTVDKDLPNAKARNDEVVRRILALARKYDVPANLVQTGHISLDERYSDEELTRKPRVFVGYEVTKRIAIVLRDVSKAEDLLSDIFKSGITRISNVEFRTTQSRKYRDQARAMAIRSAQEKARALALEIGQSIGKAFTITEEGFTAARAAMNNNFSSNVGGNDSNEDNTIALGQISITARVTVSFELK
jgi:uncharacterized protein